MSNLKEIFKIKWYYTLLGLLASAFQSYALIVALTAFNNGWVVITLAVIVTIVVNMLLVKHLVSKQQIPKSLLIFAPLIAIVAVKSLFRTPMMLIEGYAGVVVGIGLWLFLVVAIGVLLVYLEHLKWVYTETKSPRYRILLYMIPGLVVSIFLWLCNWPCITQPDSAYIWEMTSTNHYLNSHPLTYTMFLKLLRKIWDFQGIMVMLQIPFCAFVYGYVAYTFEKLGLKRIWCWMLAILLAILPVNALNSVTFLKDIPYNMGLVLMSAVLLNMIVHDKLKWQSIMLLGLACIIALFSRHNSILVIPLSLGYTAFAYMLKKKWKVFWLLIGITVITVSIKFGATKAIEKVLEDKLHKVPSLAEAMMLPTLQCAYTTSQHWEEYSDEQKEDFNWYFNAGYYNAARKKSDYWIFNYKYQLTVNRRRLGANLPRFIKFYLGLLRDYPGSMMRGYEKITAIAWCAPEYGYTMARNYAMPDWGANIGLEFKPLLPKAQVFIDEILLKPREGHKMILWRPALSLLLCFILSYLAVRRWGIKALAVYSPAFFSAFSYMVVNPAQCTRYLYSNFSIFFIFLVFTLMVKVENNAEVLEEAIENE